MLLRKGIGIARHRADPDTIKLTSHPEDQTGGKFCAPGGPGEW